MKLQSEVDADVLRAVLPVFIEECLRDGVKPDLSDPFAPMTLRYALELWTDGDGEMSAAEAWRTAWDEREAWREVTSR